jgi:hypothetical protein
LTELVVGAGGELQFQLVVNVLRARDPLRDFTDETFFLGGVDRPAQVTRPSMVMIFTFGPRTFAERSHRLAT